MAVNSNKPHVVVVLRNKTAIVSVGARRRTPEIHIIDVPVTPEYAAAYLNAHEWAKAVLRQVRDKFPPTYLTGMERAKAVLIEIFSPLFEKVKQPKERHAYYLTRSDQPEFKKRIDSIDRQNALRAASKYLEKYPLTPYTATLTDRQGTVISTRKYMCGTVCRWQ